MAYKYMPSETELDAVAAELAALGRPGATVLMWLRMNHGRLMELNQAGWTWRWIAEAMNRAKITYRTGNPWTADYLRIETHKIRRAVMRAETPASKSIGEAPVVQAAVQPDKTERTIDPAPIVGPSAPSRPPEKPRFTHAEFADPQPVVELTAEELERYERIRRKVFGPDAPTSNRFKPVTFREPPPTKVLTPEEREEITLVRKKVFGTE